MYLFKILENVFSKQGNDKTILTDKAEDEKPEQEYKKPSFKPHGDFKKKDSNSSYKKNWDKKQIDNDDSRSSYAQSAYVLWANDGDSFEAMHNKQRTKFRMAGIDAPELARKGDNKKSEPLAWEAKIYLEEIIKGKVVYLDLDGIDTYGRHIATVFIDRDKTQNVNQMMIAKGYASSQNYTNDEMQPTLTSDEYQMNEDIEDLAEESAQGIWGVEDHPKTETKKSGAFRG